MGGSGYVSLSDFGKSSTIVRGKPDKPTPYKGDSGARNINDAVTLSGTKKEEGLLSKVINYAKRWIDFFSK